MTAPAVVTAAGEEEKQAVGLSQLPDATLHLFVLGVSVDMTPHLRNRMLEGVVELGCLVHHLQPPLGKPAGTLQKQLLNLHIGLHVCKGGIHDSHGL